MNPHLALAFAATLCSAAALAQTPPPRGAEADVATAAAPVRRPDERSAENPLTVPLFGRPLVFGLSYEVSQERRLNFDLDATRQRGRDVLGHELKVDARWRIAASTRAFVQAVGLADRRTALADGSVQSRHSVERGQTWLMFENLGGEPLSLQAGRVALIERRSWWWDDDLDALRLSYAPSGWRLDTAVARELAKVSSADRGITPDVKGVTRWFGHARWPWAGEHLLESFWLVASDRSGTPPPGSLVDDGQQDPSDASRRWLGLRASGEVRSTSGHRWLYRADAAQLRGTEVRTPFTATASGQLSAGNSSRRSLRSSAWDLGLQWRLPGSARPTFSLALAQGAGGADSDARDDNFHQTGLQENKGRMAGVKRIRYYGELLDPELSNLRVASLGFGLRALANSSVELLLHDYRQRVASTRLAGARLPPAPQGLHRHIGRELDLLIAVREWRHVELTLLLARLRPGAAFAADRRDTAKLVELGATLTF